jgi:uncharacterized membrane protein YkvA (DUF1232 family)
MHDVAGGAQVGTDRQPGRHLVLLGADDLDAHQGGKGLVGQNPLADIHDTPFFAIFSAHILRHDARKSRLRRAIARAAAAYFCAVDPATPAKVKAILFAALAYFVLPFDLIPDFIVGIGFTDDAAVIALALSVVAGNIKPQHRVRARAALHIPEPAAS